MRMIIKFDLDADVIDVPKAVIDEREVLRRRFLKWICNKSIKHKYWVTITDAYGRKILGLRYRGDAFVAWLNKKVLANSEQTATLIQQHVTEYSEDLPYIFF